MEAHYFNVNLNWLNNRKGEISSPELATVIEVATPPPFAKGIEFIWSPEHLLTAAVNSCFMTTFLAIAENSKLEFDAMECNAVGTLDKVEGKYQITEITLFPIVKILDEVQKDKAIRVMEMSEKACLISNSIKSKVILEPKVTW